MAYDEHLAERIRETLRHVETAERKMFGGLGFMVDGHLTVSASGQGGLMVRIDPAQAAGLVESTPAEVVVMRGRPMPGWLRVPGEAVSGDDALKTWVERGLSFVRSLPPKS